MSWNPDFAEGDSGFYEPGHAVKVWNATREAAKDTTGPTLTMRDPAELCGLILGSSMAIANNEENPVEARNMALANALSALKCAVELAAQF